MAKGYYICICIGRLYHLPEILMCHIYLSFYDSIAMISQPRTSRFLKMILNPTVVSVLPARRSHFVQLWDDENLKSLH